jgi:hypothetical protein
MPPDIAFIAVSMARDCGSYQGYQRSKKPVETVSLFNEFFAMHSRSYFLP